MTPLFLSHFPPPAIEHIRNMIAGEDVHIKLSKPRQSKWGDFRSLRNGSGTPSISVNSNLGPPAFLITFVHEWAHYLVWRKYPFAKAHGMEWKTTFIQLMEPFLNHSCFEPSLLDIVSMYFNNPTAAISSAPALYHALSPIEPDQIPVQELQIGTVFTFRGKLYKRLEKRRTRIKCELIGQNRIYLFSQNALVSLQTIDQ